MNWKTQYIKNVNPQIDYKFNVIPIIIPVYRYRQDYLKFIRKSLRTRIAKTI